MKFKKYHYIIFLFLSMSLSALGQDLIVKGNVTADDGEPIPGVSILIKGSTQGTTTDIDGNFKIKLNSESDILVFSYIGFLSHEVSASGKTTIDVRLQPDVKQLEEIVVVGYGSQKRSEITGAVSSVNAEELGSSPSLRVEQALQGRVSGVQVIQNSGSPGSGLTVRVRGIGTIGNSDPLYVVDGVPVSGIDYLNPGDIQSIEVLKDASSAAIYGSRGANGVVLITTKSGKTNQKPVISYDMYYGVQRPWKKMNLLNATEYAIISNEAHRAAGLTPLAEFADPSSLGEGTDWQDAIFEEAPIQNHQVSISGGSEKSTYAIVGNYFDQDGIVGGDKANFKRYTFRINSKHNLTDKFTLGNNLNFSHFERDALPENNEFSTPLVRALNMDPVTPIYKEDGTFAFSKYSDTDITNPVNQIDKTNNRWTADRIVGSVYGEFEIIEGLKVKSAYSLDLSYATSDSFFPEYDLGAPNEQNPINSVSKTNYRWRTWLWENTITYNKTLNDVHDITLLGGITSQEHRHTYVGASKSDLPSNNPDDAFINTGQDVDSERAWGGAAEWSLLSYLGRVNYEFKDRYLFSATVRVDGSSRFGANNRFATFPSVSLGWIASEEDFFPKNDFITQLKLRASWGKNGNQEIGLYEFTSAVTSGLSYTFSGDEIITNGSAPIKASNSDLKWETSTQTDFGIDAEFWDGKLLFSTDYYIKETSDMLVTIPIPTHVGTAPPTVNAGTVKNKGWEISLDYSNAFSGFEYSVGGNISFLSNEVTSLGAGGDPINAGFLQSANGFISRTDVGTTIGAFYGYATDGIFQNQSEIDAHAFQSAGTAPGDIRFKDINGDNVIDDNDKTYIGDPIPSFIYGLNASASYKNFDLKLFIQGSHGNDVYNGIVRYDFDYVNKQNDILDRWTGEGSTNSTPRVIIGDPNQNARISDRFVEDGSYLRLKNIQLGYTLPSKITEKLSVSKFRVYMSAQNLLTLTGYSGLDPEMGTRGSLEIGIDRGFYPQSRTILGGLSITF